MTSEDIFPFKLVSKMILGICFTFVSCFWIYSCQLDEKIIQECQSSCENHNSHMRSVTSRECECYSKENTSRELFVLPQN